MRLFENRRNAAENLSENLEFLREEKPIVVGLMNGGVIIAEIVAKHLDAPLDVMLIEKLSAPKVPDHVVGVVDEHGRISMIESVARWHHLTSQKMVEPARIVFEKLQKRRARIREILPEREVRRRTVIIVDEGVDKGARMLGAISSMRDRGAAKIVVAAPAGASRACWQLRDTADVVVIPHQPSKYKGVNHFYRNFPAISDETVYAIIERQVKERPEQQQSGVKTIQINVKNSLGMNLACELDIPPTDNDDDVTARPAVLFAHGFESNSISPRNVPISRRLAKRGIIGMRLDFTGHGRSEGTIEQATDEQMLSDLRNACSAILNLKEIDPKRLGMVGSGTGGCIAMKFAASEPLLNSLVLRGPLCGDESDIAPLIKASTLIIHAESDTALEEGVNSINDHLSCTHEYMRIPQSNRLFNDPISMELMINATVEWFVDHLMNVQQGKGLPIGQTTGELSASSINEPD